MVQRLLRLHYCSPSESSPLFTAPWLGQRQSQDPSAHSSCFVTALHPLRHYSLYYGSINPGFCGVTPALSLLSLRIVALSFQSQRLRPGELYVCGQAVSPTGKSVEINVKAQGKQAKYFELGEAQLTRW
jgi:hypothetical protein